MKKTPLAIASVIIIGASMVFAFAGVRQGELPQNVKALPRVASTHNAVAAQVAANDDAALATLTAPMDTQADILIDDIQLTLHLGSPVPEVLPAIQPVVPAIQPVVDDAASGILTAEQSASDKRSETRAESNRSVQEALADMREALDRLSQQAKVARESVAVLVSKYEASR